MNAKKTQHRGSDKKPSVPETGTAKPNSAESSHGSVSDSRRPPVKKMISWLQNSYGNSKTEYVPNNSEK